MLGLGQSGLPDSAGGLGETLSAAAAVVTGPSFRRWPRTQDEQPGPIGALARAVVAMEDLRRHTITEIATLFIALQEEALDLALVEWRLAVRRAE